MPYNKNNSLTVNWFLMIIIGKQIPFCMRNDRQNTKLHGDRKQNTKHFNLFAYKNRIKMKSIIPLLLVLIMMTIITDTSQQRLPLKLKSSAEEKDEKDAESATYWDDTHREPITSDDDNVTDLLIIIYCIVASCSIIVTILLCLSIR